MANRKLNKITAEEAKKAMKKLKLDPSSEKLKELFMFDFEVDLNLDKDNRVTIKMFDNGKTYLKSTPPAYDSKGNIDIYRTWEACHINCRGLINRIKAGTVKDVDTIEKERLAYEAEQKAQAEAIAKKQAEEKTAQEKALKEEQDTAKEKVVTEEKRKKVTSTKKRTTKKKKVN